MRFKEFREDQEVTIMDYGGTEKEWPWKIDL